MENTTDISAPRRLTRPRDGRWLGGVAAGLGAYFDLSPTIYRIAFVALALAGGTGVLLYVAAWLVIPDATEEDSLAERFLREHAGTPRRALALALVAFVALVTLSSAHWWPTPGNLWLALALAVVALFWFEAGPRRAGGGPAPARRRPVLAFLVGGALVWAGVVGLLDATGAWNPDWPIVLGALVVLAGALVVGGAVAGFRVAGTAVVGAILLAAFVLALTAHVPVFAGWGTHTAHPRSFQALASSYEHGVGDYTLDLSDVRLPQGETQVTVKLGAGSLRVLVPRKVTVRVDAHAGAGKLRILGQEDDGHSLDEHVTVRGAQPGRVLVLDGRVGAGLLAVERG